MEPVIDPKEAQQVWAEAVRALAIAEVVDNNQPGWRCIIETEPNVTLPVGMKLYREGEFILPKPQDGKPSFLTDEQRLKCATSPYRLEIAELRHRNEVLSEILQELVDLNDLKKRIGYGPHRHTGTMLEQYKASKPLAWEKARLVLADSTSINENSLLRPSVTVDVSELAPPVAPNKSPGIA